MEVVKFRAHGQTWQFILLSDEEFEKLYPDLPDGSITAAVTETEERKVYSTASRINLNTIKHEIFHVYYTYIEEFNESANISITQVEEIFAVMFEKFGEEMIKKSKSIFRRLNK